MSGPGRRFTQARRRTEPKHGNEQRLGAKKGSDFMSRMANGVWDGTGSNGKQLSTNTTGRRPRRIVMLTGGEQGNVSEVLLELKGEEVTGKRLHAEVQRLARERAGALVAAEWLGPLGWTRFLWCGK
jgi:hypothetical protein